MALRWFKKKTESEKEIADQPQSPEQERATTDSSEPIGFVKRLRKGLAKTRKILTTDIDKLFTGKGNIDDDLLEKLEELLITADIGVQTTMELIERISKKSLTISDADELKAALKEEILSYLQSDTPKTEKAFAKPHVVMVLGVNGVGKTTTIGKLAARSVADGKKVLIAAADTFRAAAVEQLAIWADRAGAEIVKHKGNADPAAVAYDCVEAAVAREADFVFVDTAGRLHTRVNLMEELKKIKRTISKKLPDAPHEILLVLDATTGQNALSQAKLFNDALEVTGIALTKLDGTAKGGIVVSIGSTLKIPLEYIGIGENIEDLQNFDPIQFVNALF
ncbi:signal recognition particle-docking protein FtsY [Desulfobacteraceae bacterium SEEP-SAG9]|nr:signal recognition particle-docking protein FtsY [Desulfobacteraceae bacterium SEEP-SAG9]